VIDVDTSSFFAIGLVAAIAAITVAIVPRRYAPPVVVLELLMGIVIGPQVLDLAHSDHFIQFFSNLGLGMLFYFAGYEIDFERIKGRPMRLGALGWALSVALAYGIGGSLAAAGIVVSFLYTGSAMATTAIGTLIPILRDNGELKTRFGTYLLAAGGAGEFGPILLVTLVLTTASPLKEAAILIAFVALALALALASVRYAWRGWPALERTFETSSQLAVRITVVLVFGLVLLASQLGLDVLLGGFVAGMITRAALRGHELRVFESKLTAVGFGFLRPVLLHHQRAAVQPRRARLGGSDRQALHVPRPLPDRARHPGAAPLPRRAGGARPRRARLLLRDRAAPGRGDHDDRHQRRQDALLDCSRPGRRGDALDPDLPLRRSGAAPGGRGGRNAVV
jgi:Kef-type K+ transport system membrane component KefB